MKRTLLNKRRIGSFWNRLSGRKQAADHDSLVEYIQKEQDGALIHVHDKPLVSEGWRTAAGIALAIGLMAISMVAGYYATHHDDSEAFPYRPDGKGILIP